MITINKPEIVHSGDNAVLRSRVALGGREETLWFKVQNEYAGYLCDERADPFLVSLLYLAMQRNEDITVTGAPVSSKLYYQVTQHLIPALAGRKGGGRQIAIHCDTAAEKLETLGVVGTGMSCGVDSLYTLYEHSRNDCPQEYRITHLTVFNTGSSHSGEQLIEGVPQEIINERAGRIHKDKCDMAKAFCREYGYRFVEVDSNVSDIVNVLFNLSHTYRHCGAVLALQKLFGTYYYSSGGLPLSFFKISLDCDSAYYDHYLLNMLSTGTVCFYPSGETATRLEKTTALSRFPPSYKYLNPCVNGTVNCGYCDKCRRVLLTLDCADKLDKFSGVFDTESYRMKEVSMFRYLFSRDGKYRSRALLSRLFAIMYMLDYKNEKYFFNDIFGRMKDKGIKIPLKAILWHGMSKLKALPSSGFSYFKAIGKSC